LQPRSRCCCCCCCCRQLLAFSAVQTRSQTLPVACGGGAAGGWGCAAWAAPSSCCPTQSPWTWGRWYTGGHLPPTSPAPQLQVQQHMRSSRGVTQLLPGVCCCIVARQHAMLGRHNTEWVQPRTCATAAASVPGHRCQTSPLRMPQQPTPARMQHNPCPSGPHL
jgi:hypothetical protein